jgi:hypothetical protein
MISHKLSISASLIPSVPEIADLIFCFVETYNCVIAPKYALTRKLLTMRDIGWICKFMSECKGEQLVNWKERYYWALRVLAIEGANFAMG